MKPSQFDFERFKDFRAQREEEMAALLNGESQTNVLVVEENGSDYTRARTPQESPLVFRAIFFLREQ